MSPVERLKRRPDFLKVASARRKWAMPGLVLQARRRGDDAPHPEPGRKAPAAKPGSIRVGFTASRKVGGAVERNRARRRLRAAAQAVLPDEARPGFDFVLIARAGTLGRPYGDLVDDLRTALAKLGAARDVRHSEDAQ